jgi:dihydroorotase
MDLLLKNVRLYDRPDTAQDLLLRNGRIAQWGTDLAAGEGVETWTPGDGATIVPGFFDVGVHAGDPGYEHREDLTSVARAAAAGGFTAVALFPNTHPALHSKAEILYVQNKTAALPVAFYPIGAVSRDTAGVELAELYDMAAAGARAFSDGREPVHDAGLLLRALQYVRAFDGLIINKPHHKSLAAGGQMHEGVVSTMLGLKGLPALAEEVALQRDLSLLAYAGSRLHVHLVSTAGSVAQIRAARRAGLPVTCSVALANLCFTDEQLATFESNWKLLPPLRSEADRQALLDGLADGTIDFIATNHTPWDEEAKNLEFPYAEFGMTALETAFALCRTYLADRLSLADIVEKLALAPRRVLGLPVPAFEPGAAAELAVVAPDAGWTYERTYSKSRNTPFLGRTLRGKVLGVVGNGQVVRNY